MNKNECSQFSRLGILYIYHELSSSDQKAFERHLKDCPICQEQLADFRSVIIDIKGLQPLKPGPKAVEKIIGAIRSKEVTEPSITTKRHVDWLPRLGFGLAAVILIGLVWLIVTNLDRSSQSPLGNQGKEDVNSSQFTGELVQPQLSQPVKEEMSIYEWENGFEKELSRLSDDITILNWSLKPISSDKIDRRLEQLQEEIDKLSKEIDKT